MCGARDAVANWAEEHSSVFIDIGFRQGRVSPHAFYHAGGDPRAYVHVDDCVLIGQFDL